MTPPTTRLTSLDGLRGVAALVVMLYHGGKIAAPALGDTGEAVYEVLSESPAKVLFAGTEAVLVFFALSGLVVSLPAFRPGFSWAGYFGSRLIRLYLPVWGALAVATLLIVLIPRDVAAASAGSWLVAGNATNVTPASFAAEASLLLRSYDIDNVLWSLRWELIFSVTLPVFVLLASALRRFAPAALAVSVCASLAGRLLGIDALVYLPVFFAGAVLASRLPDLLDWCARRSRGFWIAAAAVSIAMLIAGWLARPAVTPGTDLGLALWGLAAFGAVGLVVVAVGSAGAARALSTRPVAWLGRVSFSLYLVHVPVLATLAFAWGEANWPWVLAAGFPASLLLAEVFTRLVERPSHRLARAVRGKIAGAVAPRTAAREPSVP